LTFSLPLLNNNPVKALRWYARKDVRYVEVPEPSAGSGQLKVKVSLAGICGTDLKEYAAGPVLIPPAKAPVTMGHEFCGTVAAVGKGVKGFKEGDRVSGVGYYYCGECYVCKKGLYNLCVNQGFTGLTTDGCMAEYFVLPDYACYKLPDSVSDEQGVLVEPLAVALHAVNQARIKKEDTVAIVGDGAIGLCCLLAARAAGVSEVYVIAKHSGRGALAKKLGAAAVIYADDDNPVKKIQSFTYGIGVNASIECVGRPETPQLAVELTQRGGITVVTGIFEKPGILDFSSITFTEKTLVGSSIYVDEGRTAVALLALKRIDPSPLISSVVPLKDAVEKGFQTLLGNKDGNIKVLLRAG
jgi:(R,R)-butanediol dehydrogenase/meso-butanediol dehydrogenase/diacetyl reductase